MLTKGYIQSKVLSEDGGYKYMVYIPFMSTAGVKIDTIMEATLAYSPSIHEELVPGEKDKGDCVIVGFEEHHANKPIIIGKLCEVGDINTPRGFANLEKLEVSQEVSLPKQTTIECETGKYTLSSIVDKVNNLPQDLSQILPPISANSDTSKTYIAKAKYNQSLNKWEYVWEEE